MANSTRFNGVNFTTLRMALFAMYFGQDKGNWQKLDSPKYKYVIPMQGNFENPLNIKADPKDTFIMYWIENDTSLTQDDYVVDEDDIGWSRQKCVARVLVRFIGKDAETWVKAFRHLTKRKGVTDIWYEICNAEKLEYTSPIVPRKIDYFGLNNQVAFDVRFKLYYDEVMSTGWQPLEGINFTLEGDLTVED